MSDRPTPAQAKETWRSSGWELVDTARDVIQALSLLRAHDGQWRHLEKVRTDVPEGQLDCYLIFGKEAL